MTASSPSVTGWASWPRPSPTAAFQARRARLRSRLGGPALLASGWPRAINFPSNVHRFRPESHFLYLLGHALEGAALHLDGRSEVLYAPAPDPEDALWHGPTPSLDELSRQLGLEVRPASALPESLDAATIPPQCPRAARWLSERLGRRVPTAAADELAGADADLADALIELRLCHDEAAIDQLRQAAEVTVCAHQAGMRATRGGSREARVAAAMRAEIEGSGFSLSYSPIVTVGGEVLHAHGHAQSMADGDLLLADVGAETPEGWAADVTRTWPVSGRFSPTQRDLYQVVLDAQQAAIDRVRPGARYLDVHRAAQRALLEGLSSLGLLRGSFEELAACQAVAVFFPHGVGHLLGLDVHDMEDLGDRAGYASGRRRGADAGTRYLRLDRDLSPGMLVTIEPGYYRIAGLLKIAARDATLSKLVDWDRLEAFGDVRGIRIEDDVLVTDQGAEVLTASLPRAPAAVEALVASRA